MADVEVRLEQARSSFRRQAWQRARTQLSAVDDHEPLDPEDLERLARAAFLTGRDVDGEEAMARAHRGFLDVGEPERAARCAFWLGLTLLTRGEEARGGGWLMRAQRLVEERIEGDSPVDGYLLAAAGYQQLDGGEPAAAQAAFSQAVETGRRFDEADLIALGRLGCGQAHAAMGRAEQAVRLFDEVMVDVETGAVSTIAAGLIYCAVILACQELFDLRRAQQWTAALSDWCASQPELVPFRGQCLVHRSELAQLRGDWPEAVEEAERACRRLSDTPGRTARGMAFYQRAELHRLHGEFSRAESAFEEASRCGRSPHPGLALLRLAQGRLEAAAGAIRQVDTRVGEAPTRAEVLGARVEIMLAAGELEQARAAAGELADIAASLETPLAHPIAAQARGAVLLAEGDAELALEALRRARDVWEELLVPYRVARVRVLIARGLQVLGDHDTARIELDAAREVFDRLGARPDLERLAEHTDAARGGTAGLTPREITVVRLVASGMTNKQIAGHLVISEKTVARHLHNVFTKCGLANRAAATAYAYEHALV